MRFLPSGNLLWKWWWPLGGVAVAALLATGFIMGWSATWWAAAGAVAVVYVGVPVMAANLDDLSARGKQQAAANASQPNPNPLQAQISPQVGGSGAPVIETPSQVAATAEIPLIGETASRRGAATAKDTSRVAAAQGSPAADVAPPREMLQRRIAATTGRQWRPPEQPGDRPWRKVGSAQFADLVYALSVALPSVGEADDTATRSGVTRHLIRKGGRDTALQRWQAVLEQAIDDEADDVVCAEALKLTNSAELRVAVADWIGVSGGS
jgi:hypothetical protein